MVSGPKVPESRPVGCVGFSPDNPNQVLCSTSSQVLLWDIREEKFNPLPISDGSHIVTTSKMNQHGTSVAAGTMEGEVLLWDLRAMKILGNLKGRIGSPVSSLAFASDGPLLTSGARDGYVTVWDTTTNWMMRDLSIITNILPTHLLFLEDVLKMMI